MSDTKQTALIMANDNTHRSQLTKEEYKNLKSQFATSSLEDESGYGGRRKNFLTKSGKQAILNINISKLFENNFQQEVKEK